MMALMGVRISWLMLARKAVLAWLAASASLRAARSVASSSCFRPVTSWEMAQRPSGLPSDPSSGNLSVLNTISVTPTERTSSKWLGSD